MGDLDTVVDRTLAAGTARLRLFRASDPSEPWREVGHGTAKFRPRRTYIVLRPIPPHAAPVGLPPDTEIEYLFDGGRRWFRGLDAKQWGYPLGVSDDSRQVADPTWILDALLGATVVADEHDVASGLRVSLDLIAAERAAGRRVDIGRGRTALRCGAQRPDAGGGVPGLLEVQRSSSRAAAYVSHEGSPHALAASRRAAPAARSAASVTPLMIHARARESTGRCSSRMR